MANIKSIGGNPIVPASVEDGAILTASMVDGAVTPDKLAPSVAGALSSPVTQGTPITDTFIQRVTAGGFPCGDRATIQSLKGNTVRWNQQVGTSGWVGYHGTITTDDGVLTLTGSADTPYINRTVTVEANHKYLLKYDVYPESGMSAVAATVSSGLTNVRKDNPSANTWSTVAGIFSFTAAGSALAIYANYGSGNNNGKVTKFRNVMLFDLTTMFGAGNEPATVAEFEKLFPASYYAYDAGSLKSVDIEGLESVGFNRIPSWELGTINSGTGADQESATSCRTGYIPIFAGMSYCLKGDGHTCGIRFYDANKVFLGSSNNASNKNAYVFTPTSVMFLDGSTSANARYIRLVDTESTTGGEKCFNLSNPAKNGTYEPYWKQTLPITAQLRSAGSVADELTAGERITRVGSVDLGTLTWNVGPTNTEGKYRMASTGIASVVAIPSGTTVPANLTIIGYNDNGNGETYSCVDKSIGITSNGSIVVYDEQYNQNTSYSAFKTAMNGVYLFYALATPTTTPQNTNLTYRCAAGGTESFVVPTGHVSAPPTVETLYAIEQATVAASIAPVEGPKASTNYAVDSLLMLGGTLCKVTTAIATGEDILIGTNVTATTVAAVIAAL